MVGKVSELALGYQGGIGAYIKMAKSYRVDLQPVAPVMLATATVAEEEKIAYDYDLYVKRCKKADMVPCDRYIGEACSLIKLRWRAANKKIEQFWKEIESLCIAAVENPQRHYRLGDKDRTIVEVFIHDIFLCIGLPSGRCIKYPFPKVETTKNAKTGKISKKLSYYTKTMTSEWQRVSTYGGSITENIVQGIARDVFCEGLLALEETIYDTKFHVHDEVVCEVDKDYGHVEEVCRLLARVPDWGEGLPLAAEGFKCDRFEKR